MKIEYNNLYTHFVLTTLHRLPLIVEKHRERIEKYITGIVNNNHCHLYSIYANPEHVHFLASRSPAIWEETLASIVAESSVAFINKNKLSNCHLPGRSPLLLFLFPNLILIKFANTFLTSRYIIKR